MKSDSFPVLNLYKLSPTKTATATVLFFSEINILAKYIGDDVSVQMIEFVDTIATGPTQKV